MNLTPSLIGCVCFLRVLAFLSWEQASSAFPKYRNGQVVNFDDGWDCHVSSTLNPIQLGRPGNDRFRLFLLYNPNMPFHAPSKTLQSRIDTCVINSSRLQRGFALVLWLTDNVITCVHILTTVLKFELRPYSRVTWALIFPVSSYYTHENIIINFQVKINY